MRFLKRLTLPQIILAVSVVVLLVTPTIITYSLVKRNTQADDELEKVASESENLVFGAESPAEETTETDAVADAERLEQDTTDVNPLTMSDEATETDAVPLNGKKVYLTFDDGPSDNTNELLDILDEYNVKATFFVVEEDGDHAAELKRIAEEGHTIGLHSQSHIYSKLYADLNSYKRDVKGVHDWVKRVTGIDTKLYRFPGGSSNAVSNVPIEDCIEYLHDSGYEYYDWNALSKDAENAYLTPEQLNNNIMQSVRVNEGDSIVLMHDLDDQHATVEALPELIETLQSEGYELCQIDENTEPVQHFEE